jgi:hypothetical protein
MRVVIGILFIGFCIGLGVYDWRVGFAVFIAVGVALFVFFAVVDFFAWLFSPRQQYHTHVHVERHPDPTRPDWIYEDASPLVFLENGKNGGRNGK